MRIRYLDHAAGIRPDQLAGFFDGWPNPPSRERHLEILTRSDLVELAFDDDVERVVGFVTAISDGILSAYLPLLEVLPGYRGNGIGRGLIEHILVRLRHLYMIDLTCDPDLQPFYESLGMVRATAMILRNYGRSSTS